MSFGAVGDRRGLLQQVQQRRSTADAAALLHRAGRGGGDLEWNTTVDRAGFDGLSCGVEFGGVQSAAHPGLGQRPLVDEQCVQRRADAADVVLRCGLRQGCGERQRDVALDAHPHAAGMIDRQCDARAVRRLGGGGQRLDRPRATDRGRGRIGNLGQGCAADPLGDHQTARPGVGDVEDAGDAGHLDAAQLEGARQDLL